MKNKIHLKSVAAGVLLGVMIGACGTVFADAITDGSVSAYLQDSFVKIYVDNNLVSLDEDMHILNYEGRVYTPTRAIAEAMGGTVTWSESAQTIMVSKPEPEIVEKIVEVEVEVEVEKDSGSGSASSNKDIINYQSLPVRAVKNDIEINIYDAYCGSKSTFLYFNLKNESKFPIFFKYDDIYIEADKKKIKTRGAEYQNYLNTIGDAEKLEEKVIELDGIPSGVDEVTIYIPVEIVKGSFSGGKEYFTFELNLDLEGY